MYVIDTQVHVNELGLEGGLAALDAVGVDAVMIDEWTGFDPNGLSKPYRFLANGAFRALYGFAQQAARTYPGRFKYIGKVDPRDPELKDTVAALGEDPHALCIRVAPKEPLGQIDMMREGGYDAVFAAAQEARLPVMLWIPGHLELLERIAPKFDGLPLILDHCGMLPIAAGATLDPGFWFKEVADGAAAYPNVRIKLSHALSLSKQTFPFTDIGPHIRRLIDAVGEQRLMWASDHTVTRYNYSWADALYFLRVPGLLNETEQEWILGRTASEVLQWPITESFGLYRAKSVGSRTAGAVSPGTLIGGRLP